MSFGNVKKGAGMSKTSEILVSRHSSDNIETPPLFYVGHDVSMVDSKEKATGKAVYFTDIKLPKMLYGGILRSPYAHARILNVDLSKASSLSGVKAAIMAKDVPSVKYGPQMPDRNILAVDKVRFIGEEVAAVAATSTEVAQEALTQIKVEYEPLPAYFDPEESAKSDGPWIHKDKHHNIAHTSHIVRGNVTEGFAGSDVVVEETFHTQAVHCLYLESQMCLADLDEWGNLVLYLPVQTPFTWRNKVANVLGLPLSRVRVVQTHMGGAFGGKLDTPLHLIAAVLAIKANRPVRLVHSKEEDLKASFHRVPAKIWIRVGAKRNGTLISKQVRITADNGAYNSLAPKIVCTNMATRSDCLYRYHHAETVSTLVYTNKIPTSAFRGYGNPQITFAQESIIDMVAKEIEMDPVELRLKNIIQTGDITLHGWQIRSSALDSCLRDGARRIGWRRSRRVKKKMRGMGTACMIHVSGNRGAMEWDGSETIIRFHDDGTAVVLSGEAELGQGIRTVLAQITAEEIGMKIKDVKVRQVDTDVSPFALGPYSSKTTVLAGNATRLAAQKMRSIIGEKAAKMLGADSYAVRIKNGMVWVDGNEKEKMPLAEVIHWAHTQEDRETLVAHGVYDPGKVRISPQNDYYGDISATYPLAAHFAHVEVDPDTGEIRVLNYVAAHDIGRVINPLGARGQVIGGVVQGLGYSLMEEIKYDGGQVANANLVDYLIPTAKDIPRIQVLFAESSDPIGPYGAKGIGEPPLIPVAPAIANAVYDATGIRFTEIPITAEKLYLALKKNENRDQI
jgi:CO/xanthine dehydrogenase Mo-binding subunit